MLTYKLLQEKNSQLFYLPGLILIIILAAIPLFGHLSELPLQRWDESRLAVSAFEMLQSKNWLVPTFDGSPDNWSVKPPLQIWVMVASIKIFGANELAVRLPSALAALATCIFLYWLFAVKLNKQLAGILAPAILVVTTTYVQLHGTRTGDYDTLLAFFTTVYICQYFLFFLTNSGKHLLYMFIALTLAVLTKGVAGVLFLPGLLIYTLVQRKLFLVLSQKYFYGGLLLFVAGIATYYACREQVTPGYIQLVIQNELGGRYMNTLEEHWGPWYYYISHILKNGSIWEYVAVCALLILPISGKAERLIVSCFCITAVTYLFIISFAGTKLFWYTVPLHPLSAALAGLAVHKAVELLAASRHRKMKNTMMIAAAVIMVFYLAGYGRIYLFVTKPVVDMQNKMYSTSHYLQEVNQQRKKVDSLLLLRNEYEQEMVWYEHIDDRIRFEDIHNLKPGNEVMLHKEESLRMVDSMYTYTKTDEYYGIYRYRISGVKD